MFAPWQPELRFSVAQLRLRHFFWEVIDDEEIEGERADFDLLTAIGVFLLAVGAQMEILERRRNIRASQLLFPNPLTKFHIKQCAYVVTAAIHG